MPGPEFEDDIDIEIEEFARAISELNPQQLRILQLMSIAGVAFSRNSLLDAAKRLSFPGELGKTISVAEVEGALSHLKSLNLIRSNHRGYACLPIPAELSVRLALRDGFFRDHAQVIETQFFRSRIHYLTNDSDFEAKARFHFYNGDMDTLLDMLDQFRIYQHHLYSMRHPLFSVFATVFDQSLMERLPVHEQDEILRQLLGRGLRNCLPARKAFLFARTRSSESVSEGLREAAADYCIGRGMLEGAMEWLPPAYPLSHAVEGALLVLRGKYAQAVESYGTSIVLIKKTTGKRKPLIDGLLGIFHVLALLGAGGPEELKQAEIILSSVAKREEEFRNYSLIFAELKPALALRAGLSTKEVHRLQAGYQPSSMLSWFFRVLVQRWIGTNHFLSEPSHIEKAIALFESVGLTLFEAETCAIFADAGGGEYYRALAAERHAAMKTVSLLRIIPREEHWERALDALARLAPPAGAEKTTTDLARKERLVWRVSFHERYGLAHVFPFLQKQAKNGTWSAGRELSLKALLAEVTKGSEFITPRDMPVCATIHQASHRTSWGGTYRLDMDKALPALVGHPHVYWQDKPDLRVEIVKSEPELRVIDQHEGLSVDLVPRPPQDGNMIVAKDGANRLRVTIFRKEHFEILKVIGASKLSVPKEATDKVRAAITPLASLVTIHSDIGGAGGDAEAIVADPRPHVLISPHADGLKGEIRVRPFGIKGPSYPPGSGGETLIALIQEKRLQTTRNLIDETNRAHALIGSCPAIDAIGADVSESWAVGDAEISLELLLQLQRLGEDVVVEWPQGEKMRVAGEASFKQFHLAITKSRDWFVASGKLQIDENRIIEMQELLRLVGDSKSRFIQLENGEFLALTNEFRKRLEELRTLAEERGKEVRLHPLAALGVRELTEEAGTSKVDSAWKQHLERLDASMAITAEIPSTLRAELRSYQVEGFQWLTRLAAWGVGACLADDMGLGKTIQAMALLLHRAADGPAVVVAPTSVCPNWQSELQKFAPTLRVHLFGTGDRSQMLQEAGPFDLVIVSYGLLYSEAELLSTVHWRTAILDEAQAIKNVGAGRSQAAMSLQADFRILTTGTPIENHLSELWNLFRFINPGLLGSLESFNTRFANPIERLHDRHARSALRRLIQPFILRRTKEQVLDELPPRTDILHVVEMEPEEQAFYETLRREALERLDESKAEGGERHLQILAEIMRLRRACCNTRLVRAELTLPSAKLKEFRVILEELLENRHKALVFSQFVDHLAILREELDARGVSYQYLDGSTPQKERTARVNAFQAGKGDVFLISLKAGGVGLNLTASDYVIHMDPWWNPAVEDQASDRAHRIGQTRPVTVYRIVTKGTIEERIVALHQHKRKLAGSLLEGTEASGKVGAKELLELLRGW